MMRVIPQLLEALGRFFPPWALAVLAVVIAPFVVMGWIRWLKAKQVRGALRTAFLATDPARREAYVQRAFSIAGGNELALIALLDAAHTTGLVDVTNRAIGALESRGLGKKDVARIRAEISPPKKKAGHPIEELVVIERFIEQEMWSAARTRLGEARKRFPADPDLAQLEASLPSDQDNKAGELADKATP